MLKRIIATVLVFVTLIGLMPMVPLNNMTAKAATIDSGKCGDNLTWTLDSNDTLTISGTGEMYNYVDYYNESPWYRHQYYIKSIIIENGITSIGNEAFSNCVSLLSISIPNSVISIGEYAFFSVTH